MSKQDEGKTDFKVTDRRGFTSEGKPREDSGERAEKEPLKTPGDREESRLKGQPTGPPGEAAGQERKRPPIDFSSFVISLATTAMVHLGEVPDPAAGKVQKNLDAAKQMVDLLALLQEKTEGNLTPEEASILDDILYELRMKFLSKSKAIQL